MLFNFDYIIAIYEKAKRFHFIDCKPYFLDGTVYCDNGKILCERASDVDLKNEITLTQTSKRKLPYNYYLFSTVCCVLLFFSKQFNLQVVENIGQALPGELSSFKPKILEKCQKFVRICRIRFGITDSVFVEK